MMKILLATTISIILVALYFYASRRYKAVRNFLLDSKTIRTAEELISSSRYTEEEVDMMLETDRHRAMSGFSGFLFLGAIFVACIVWLFEKRCEIKTEVAPSKEISASANIPH